MTKIVDTNTRSVFVDIFEQDADGNWVRWGSVTRKMLSKIQSAIRDEKTKGETK